MVEKKGDPPPSAPVGTAAHWPAASAPPPTSSRPLPTAPPMASAPPITPSAVAVGPGAVEAIATPAGAVSSPAVTTKVASVTAVAVSPPFFIPSSSPHPRPGSLLLPDSKDWRAPKKLAKRCEVIPVGKQTSKTARLWKLSVPLEHAEVVSFIYAKEDSEKAKKREKKKEKMKKSGTYKADGLDDNGGDFLLTMAVAIVRNSLSEVDAKRTYRATLLTQGSLQFKGLPWHDKRTLLFDRDPSGLPNVRASIFDLRGVFVAGSEEAPVVVVSFAVEPEGEIEERQMGRTRMEPIRHAVLQTPAVSRLLTPLAGALLAANIGRPAWSIPVGWWGAGPGLLPALPAMSPARHTKLLGADGGFSSIVHAAVLAFHVINKVPDRVPLEGTTADVVSNAVKRQQKQDKGKVPPPMGIDLPMLAMDLAPTKGKMTFTHKKRQAIVLRGMDALSFNLIFRRLRLSGLGRVEPRWAFRDALGRALLYNVTLREVDLSGTDLSGVGEAIGIAWAMNAQPLISKVNFSDCKLTKQDLLGILQGLARIWCGGTALPESIQLPDNPQIPGDAWDVFFDAFSDPTTYQRWPQGAPPPPSLAFLQELDLRGCPDAVGPGLLRLASRMNGLRVLGLSSRVGGSAMQFLAALTDAGAPLEHVRGNGLDISDVRPLLTSGTRLQELVLDGFRGDAGPVLCGWSFPVPGLLVTLGKNYLASSSGGWGSPTETGHSPGKLIVHNSNNFAILALGFLGTWANDLKELTAYGTYYVQCLGLLQMLTTLESISFLPQGQTPNHLSILSSTSRSIIEDFWAHLSLSKSLRNLQLPDQLVGGTDSDELAMIGLFLKTNRSVQRIGFDSPFLMLKVEDMKSLRSAFYGNKKVIDLQYPEKARNYTMAQVKQRTAVLWREVHTCKDQIKRLFKRAYSKYNPNWRDGPNRDKLPFVERIRVAKREIGKIERDQKKIASLLSEIQQCIQANKNRHYQVEERKANERLLRREGQLQKLGEKKKKFATNLVTKLHKAKLKGRKGTSAKTQVSRSTYYKSPNMWPHSRPRQHGWNHHNHYYYGPHSYYHYYNDPYNVRHHWGYYNDYGSDSERGEEQEAEEKEQEVVDDIVDRDAESCEAWDGMLSEVDGGVASGPEDPWQNVDRLVEQVDTDYGAITSPEFLSQLHEECAELGPDVAEALQSTLDDGAAISAKVEDIGASTSAPTEMVNVVVDRDPLDVAALESTLVDIPEFEAVSVDDAGDDGVDEADDAVGMYAGAGPRDLDDGGPSYGGSSNAALAGARRRARARKAGRLMTRVRAQTNCRLLQGYKNLDLISGKANAHKWSQSMSWPKDIIGSWIEDARFQQIRAVSESNLFDLPAVSEEPNVLLNQWTAQTASASIEVVLVTQCSLDRLPNLKAQLMCWVGKASVAIYLKPRESRHDAENQILALIEEVKNDANDLSPGAMQFDIAVTLVEGCMDDEPYPINYLRNIALLEAQRQHLRFNVSLDKSAVLLVDVDFRPCDNLFRAMHCHHAARSILEEKKVVVCPAFETSSKNCVRSLAYLKTLIVEGKAEGFHLSHFPQGHSPTDFEEYWEKSMLCYDGNVDNFWEKSYQITHQKLFEPYIIMASSDVPLYDERFQGYGLNKVSHLATVALQKSNSFTVLPGVFLAAPTHDRSESWMKRYGKCSDETWFNQLSLKGLYYSFMENLTDGPKIVVSESTRIRQYDIAKDVKAAKNNYCECQDDEQPSSSSIIPMSNELALCY